jgi:hypothetical protein
MKELCRIFKWDLVGARIPSLCLAGKKLVNHFECFDNY